MEERLAGLKLSMEITNQDMVRNEFLVLSSKWWPLYDQIMESCRSLSILSFQGMMQKLSLSLAIQPIKI